MIVLHTSALIDLFRGVNSKASRRVAALEGEGAALGIPAICFQEILQGARDEAEWRLLEEALSTQQILEPLDAVGAHHEAARVFFELRRRGVTIRSTVDCLIAAMVIERDAVLLHADADLERIKKVRPLRTDQG